MRDSLLNKSNVEQKKSDDRQHESNNSSGIGIQDIEFIFSHSEVLSKKAMNKNNIAASMSAVKMNNFLQPFFLEKLGTIITTPSQPADRLTNKSENTESQFGSKLYIRLLYQRGVD